MPKKRKKTKKSNGKLSPSRIIEKVDYSKVSHTTKVDQSDRHVPYNLRQSGPTKVELLMSTRVRKSPYWHLSMKAGCWRATVYNRIYHPRGYVRPEKGGAMVEYKAIKNHVTMWNVAVERQIRVKGPDAERFTDYVITRDATKISPMRARYVILCNYKGGVLNDPILLRISKNRLLSQFSKIYIGFFRGVPLLVILYWIYFAMPELGYEILMISSFTAAILGMGIHGSAFMAEVFRSGIQALNIGQMEASLSLGMTPLNALRFIILPQAIRIGLPPTANFAVGLLKETALCSIIAVPELMLRAKDVASSSFLPMQAFVMAAVFYYIMSFPMMRLVDYLERRMGKSSLS